jgi:DNA-3-methyladenine glycosylase I
MNKFRRCKWLDLSKVDYINYHDYEWGVPIYNDYCFFENIVLESAQAGLTWYSILQRRKYYKQAYEGFNVEEVSRFGDIEVSYLLENKNIIRHKGKIESSINNAKVFIKIQGEFNSFSNYIWSFFDGIPLIESESKEQAQQISLRVHKDLKHRGFQFFGEKITYAFLLACGLLNGHDEFCFKHYRNLS